MKRIKQWLAIFLLMGTGILLAQEDPPPAPIATPPESGILDNSKFLGRNAEIAARISTAIHQLAINHGYRIYLYIEPVLIGATAQEKANDLRRTWRPDGDGLVVVFESDSRNLGIGQDMIGDPNMKENPHRVPSYETTAILNKAITSVDISLASELYLEAVMSKIVAGFNGYFIRREAPTPPARSIRSTLLVIGALTLLALGMIGAGGLVRHTSMARIRTFRFPVVDRPERLGAPCGGSVTSRRFAPKRNASNEVGIPS